jgi:hypothetical protein
MLVPEAQPIAKNTDPIQHPSQRDGLLLKAHLLVPGAQPADTPHPCAKGTTYL